MFLGAGAIVMKRVLVLHGYSQNATVFGGRLGALRKESKNIEYVFINAPHILLPSELMGSTVLARSELEEAQADPELALRAWWKVNREGTQAIGLQESIMSVREVLRTQKFDGVLGFSQGAAFAAILTSLLERPDTYAPFLVDGKAPHPPFQFCIAVSGFRLKDPFCAPLYSPQFTTPTLHVIGRTDVVVVEERSRQLIEVSGSPRVEEHDGGHFVPSKGQWRKFLVAYMKDPTGSHPSPSPPVVDPEASADTSGQAVGDYKNALMMKL